MRFQLVLCDDEPRVDSRLLAEGLEIGHRFLVRTIDNHQANFESLGILRFQNAKIGGRGRPERIALLNEDQAYFALSLSRNTEPVVAMKHRLVVEFGRLRRKAVQAGQCEWLEARAQGRISRREETDAIQEFVEYATRQGSTKARMYFVNLTKATYKALFLIEQGADKPNRIRDLLDGQQLTTLAVAEMMAARSLRAGIEQELHYKEIFQLAKTRLEALGELMGRVPLLEVASKQDEEKAA